MKIALLICHVHQRQWRLFNKIDDAAITIEGRKICVLKYADELVLIANSEDGLQKSLNSLYSYCAQNNLSVNTSKSKIMHFTKFHQFYKHEQYGIINSLCYQNYFLNS